MDETGIDVLSILSLLRRQIRLILLIVVLCVASAALVIYLLTPIYSATALVLFDPNTRNLLDPDAPQTATGADNARIDSEVEIIRSNAILLQVVDEADLANNAEFTATANLRQALASLFWQVRPLPETPDTVRNHALVKLLASISVQRRGATYLIAIEARSADPETAARVANTLAKVYTEGQLAAKVASVMTASELVQTRMTQAHVAVVATDEAFDGFIADNIEKITQESGRPELAVTQNRIAELSQTRADIEASIEADTATDGKVLRSQLAETQASEQYLRQQLRQDVLSSSLHAGTLAQLYDLRQAVELARTQYQTLLARAQDVDNQAHQQVADSRVVSPAFPPPSPSWPNPPLALLLAAMGGLGLGILVALAYDNLIGGLITEEQTETVLKTRVATTIARTRPQSASTGLADLVVNAPLSSFAESVRRIRAAIDHQILLATPDRCIGTGRVIMVSSSAPSEGKTTIGLALARSYALTGRATLLIDCDLRRPSVHRLLDIAPSHGLNEFLDDAIEQRIGLDSIISTDAMSKATVIVGAHSSQFPTDQLLTAAAFAKLIDAARASYDVVILDSPPIGPVIDGLYIAPFADVIVFVVKWASTAQRDARKTLASLNSVKRPGTAILSVLNQQDETTRADRRKYGDYHRAA